MPRPHMVSGTFLPILGKFLLRFPEEIVIYITREIKPSIITRVLNVLAVLGFYSRSRLQTRPFFGPNCVG